MSEYQHYVTYRNDTEQVREKLDKRHGWGRG